MNITNKTYKRYNPYRTRRLEWEHKLRSLTGVQAVAPREALRRLWRANREAAAVMEEEWDLELGPIDEREGYFREFWTQQAQTS